jgi:hypothetical protein
MAYDIRTALADPEKARRFAERFMGGYLTPAFGARSKSEIDLLVLEALAAAGALDVEGPIYDLARTFNITPARARSLVMAWQLRNGSDEAGMREKLIAALGRTRFAKDGTYLAFGVESPLVREEIIARLKREGVFADASFSRELIRLPVDAFVDFLEGLLDAETKQAVKARLVADKQLPDRSFKALATGVLAKLGEKVAGKAGEAVAEQVVGVVGDVVVKPAAERMTSFLVGLLSRDVDKAVGSVMSGEYAEDAAQ